MRLAWLTDIHLNFVDAGQVDALCREIEATGADAVLLGGDIAEAEDLIGHLEGLDDRLARPIYHVLGNHDYYRGAIGAVRAEVSALATRRPRVRWLPAEGVVPLTGSTALVGHDGWSDARIGDYAASPLVLNDYRLIDDLKDLDPTARRVRLETLGDEAAAHLRATLPAALERFERVLVLTHVPPFREACKHPGRFAWDDWLPHFTCKAMGDALVEAAEAFPDRALMVLCGHVHSSHDVTIRPNLRVLTGGAAYGKPGIEGVLTID
ncbi:MAG: metallophosphoesterase [Thermoleophilia bacterium]|nr:metallophosphoesterase [Thermoleophilia bacterium]